MRRVEAFRQVLCGVLVKTVAKIGREVFLDDAAEETWERSGNGYQNPDKRGEDHARNGDGLE
jgi:hypothetical protein